MSINLLYALLLGILPSIVWLIFWTREDANPEPKSLLAACFFGGMITVLVALIVEKVILEMGYSKDTTYILLASIEEVMKFIVFITVAMKAKGNREPIDAVMYCITIALGFAAMENTLFIMGPFAQGDIVNGLLSSNLRFLGASLVHTLSTACIGFAYGYVFYHGKFPKLVGLLLGLVAGIAIHSTFNISIHSGESLDVLKAFSWIWGGVIMMLVMFEEIKAVRPKVI